MKWKHKIFRIFFVLFTLRTSCGEGNRKESAHKKHHSNKGHQVPSHLSQHTLYAHAGSIDDEAHECYRECTPNTPPKQCHYHFQVEWYYSMSKACYNCPVNITDCSRPHCVPTDGRKRTIVTVNRRLPGPTIQVCEGDEIIVDVENLLVTDTTTIHWHGLHQKGTPYMDGVPLLTQCPIAPGSTFRYHFLADPPGTHYWHSHSGFQRADGVFGNLIIKSKNDKHRSLYDIDDSRFAIFLTDWMDLLAVDKFSFHHHYEHNNKPYNLLVNGLGKYQPYGEGKSRRYAPLPDFRVRKGVRYRFRSISNSVQNCPIVMSIDDHKLLVIASDGSDLEPVEVESLVIYAGERWDFVVSMDQDVKSYWIKFQGLLDCDERFLSAYQVAVLRYEGSTHELPGDLDDLNYNSTMREGLQLNKLNVAPGDFKTFMTAADVRGFESGYQREKYERTPDYKFWIDFDFYDRDNYLFHDAEHYPFYGVMSDRRVFSPQMNNISMKFPSSPPLSQPDDVSEKEFCNATSHPNCEKFCHCVHTLNLELGSLVEIILVDKGWVYYANHPFHMHGHLFAVLGMGDFGENTTLELVHDYEKRGKLQRNFENPPLKDSVTVPDGGYTIIRFIADNPGYWLFHCHLTFHVEVGMALIFHVGHRQHLPPVPKDFPVCRSWLPKPSTHLRQDVQSWAHKLQSSIDNDEMNNSYFYYKTDDEKENVDSSTKNYAMNCPLSSSILGLTLFLIIKTLLS